jgi:hypothetical protein
MDAPLEGCLTISSKNNAAIKQSGRGTGPASAASAPVIPH